MREREGLLSCHIWEEVTFGGKDALANLICLYERFYRHVDGSPLQPLCNDVGGVVDDLIVYRVVAEHYLCGGEAAIGYWCGNG